MGRPVECPICRNSFLNAEYERLKGEGLKGPAIAPILGVSVERVDMHRKNCVYRRGLRIKSYENTPPDLIKGSSNNVVKPAGNSEVKQTELEQLETLRETVQRVMGETKSARDVLDCIGELRQISGSISKLRSEERNAGMLADSAFVGDSEKLLRALADANIPEVWDVLCGNPV